MTKKPDFSLEKRSPFEKIAGIDEAGCGPWAGPVVAASVIFLKYDEHQWSTINDSKKLSAKKREQCYEALVSSTDVVYSIGIANAQEIDQFNIARATCLAMEKAVEGLSSIPDYLLIDGIRKPPINIPSSTVIKGDSQSISIAAASIIAKVTRDKIMYDLSIEYPNYYWHKNAGYGTAQHQAALESHGITPHHRKSFAPIRALLGVAV